MAGDLTLAKGGAAQCMIVVPAGWTNDAQRPGGKSLSYLSTSGGSMKTGIKRKGTTRKLGWMAILAAGVAVLAGAQTVWNDADLNDSRWATGGNWVGGNPPAGATARARFFDMDAVADKPVTNSVHQDYTVRTIDYLNMTNIVVTRIEPGATLLVKGSAATSGNQGQINVGLIATSPNYLSNVNVRVTGGGTLRMGGDASDYAQRAHLEIGVGWSTAGSAVIYPKPAFCGLTIEAGVFDLANTDQIRVGAQLNSNFRVMFGLLDLRGAFIRSGNATNTIRLSGAFNLGTGAGTSGGQIFLPPAITNITVGSFAIGGAGNEQIASFPNNLVLGTNAQLRTLTVTNEFDFSRGRFLHYDVDGNSHTGLPGHVAFTMGTASHRAGYMRIATGGNNNGVSDRTVHTFGPGIGTFHAHVAGLNVASGSVNGHHRWGALDLRGATVTAFDIAGQVKIGGVSGHGRIYCPAGTITCASLQVGVGASGFIAGTGLLSLSNTQFEVTGGVTVGDPFATTPNNYPPPTERGLVETTINGVSCGLDIGGTLTVTNVAAIKLDFVAPPSAAGGEYSGLRVAGDQTAALEALHAAGKLTWTTAGIPEADLPRIGIHYQPRRDYTYVGLAPPRGTLLTIH